MSCSIRKSIRCFILAILALGFSGGGPFGATALACVQTISPSSEDASPLAELTAWEGLPRIAIPDWVLTQTSEAEPSALYLPLVILGSLEVSLFPPSTADPRGAPDPAPTAEPPPGGDSAVDLTHLPLGDGLVLRRDRGQREPAVGSLWLCGVPAQGRGASDASDWSNGDGTWDFTRKPIVDGQVPWQSEFEVELDGQGRRIITGNALPSFETGVFPIDPSSLAYRYDRNPSHIEAQTVELVLDARPETAPRPNCLPYGATGISLTGNAIYHGASTLGTDAAAYEMLDRCGGQSDGTFTYHTHFLTPCLLEALDSSTGGHSALMGYILDGFGIYGPRGEDGSILTSEDLDACHGHTHPVEWDGETVDLYHYHWTYDFPYNVGCFKGVPIKAWN